MKKLILSMFLVLMGLSSVTAQRNLYKFTVEDMYGEPQSMAQYKGKILLIVNTATRCGFTPQYEELQKLYDTYREDGVEILDFPCNQFGEQAPGSIREIHDFCTSTYNVTFPQFAKVDVNGAEASPLFSYLKKKQGFRGFDTSDRMGALLDNMLRSKDAAYDKSPDIKWNFTKFLVDRKGRVVARFEPTEPIADVEMEIINLIRNRR